MVLSILGTNTQFLPLLWSISDGQAYSDELTPSTVNSTQGLIRNLSSHHHLQGHKVGLLEYPLVRLKFSILSKTLPTIVSFRIRNF